MIWKRLLDKLHWRRGALPVAVLLLLHAALLAFGSVRHSPTRDEPIHLASGVYHWRFGRFDLNRGNPPLTDLVAASPVLLARARTDWSRLPHTPAVARDFVTGNGLRTSWLVTLGRWACMSFSLIGGYFCFRWASELYGYACGLAVLTLWCFSPHVLAYGQSITGDMPATALGIAAFYVYWRWLVRPSLGGAVLAGLFLGLAELAKFVWLLLFGLWPVLWIVWKVLHRGNTPPSGWLSEIGHLALMNLVSLYVINLGYGFERPFQPLGQFEVGQRILEHTGSGSPETHTGSPDSGNWISALPVPLPENYVLGIDEILTVCDRRTPTFLRLEWRRDGFWYYYPYALLVKMPLGAIGLLALAMGTSLLRAHRAQWKTELLLVMSAVAVFYFVTASDAPQIDRYVLPVLPFLLILAGKAGRLLASQSRPAAMIVAGLLSWATVSSLWVYPHSLAYFNEAAGGPFGGHAHLIGSSIDWGQDFLYLKRWQDRHPEARPLGLTWQYYIFDAGAFGVDSTDVPPGLAADRHYRRADMIHLGPQPGWYAINVSALHTRSQEYAYFFCFHPVATAGYSHYIYHITLEEANRVRRELGMPQLSAGWNRNWRMRALRENPDLR